MPLDEKQKALLKAGRGIAKSRLVTLIIPRGNTQTILYFNDQADLRYARILGMEVVALEDFAQPLPTLGPFIPVLPQQLLRWVAVSLETNDPDKWDENYPLGHSANDDGRFRDTWQTIKNQPLVTFHRMIGQPGTSVGGVYELFEFNNTFITWDKSLITMPDPVQVSQGFAVCFKVYYTFRSVNGRLIPHK